MQKGPTWRGIGCKGKGTVIRGRGDTAISENPEGRVSVPTLDAVKFRRTKIRRTKE